MYSYRSKFNIGDKVVVIAYENEGNIESYKFSKRTIKSVVISECGIGYTTTKSDKIFSESDVFLLKDKESLSERMIEILKEMR